MALSDFDPEAFITNWRDDKFSPLQSGTSFAQCIRDAFHIPATDGYVYRAQAETTLDITQRAIGGKRSHGLHGWYCSDEGMPMESQYPTSDDITAYIGLFDPSLNLPKAFSGFKANAKTGSIRSKVAQHLDTRFYNKTQGLLPNKKPRNHLNPYLSLWAYSCHELEWAGPISSTSSTRISHHILPVFYHHFGCVVPSYTALYVIAKLAQPAKPSKEPVRPILDIGSGNGHWSFMLRNFPIHDISGAKPLDVRAIDNGLSEYRVSWIKDTITADGKEYLKHMHGGKGCVLLLVYPQATGDFTRLVLQAFEGDVVVVVGTQNNNGFTGFRNQIVDEWISEHMSNFELLLRIPVPSFAGKDEALFVFQRVNKSL